MAGTTPRNLRRWLVVCIAILGTFLGQDFVVKSLEVLNSASITVLPTA